MKAEICLKSTQFLTVFNACGYNIYGWERASQLGQGEVGRLGGLGLGVFVLSAAEQENRNYQGALLFQLVPISKRVDPSPTIPP